MLVAEAIQNWLGSETLHHFLDRRSPSHIVSSSHPQIQRWTPERICAVIVDMPNREYRYCDLNVGIERTLLLDLSHLPRSTPTSIWRQNTSPLSSISTISNLKERLFNQKDIKMGSISIPDPASSFPDRHPFPQLLSYAIASPSAPVLYDHATITTLSRTQFLAAITECKETLLNKLSPATIAKLNSGTEDVFICVLIETGWEWWVVTLALQAIGVGAAMVPVCK